MQVQSIMLDLSLICVIQISLILKNKCFILYKIHNLLLPTPGLKKQKVHKLNYEVLAITEDRMFVTFPFTFEVMGCSLSTETYCEMNSAIYPTSTLHNCEYALFIKNNKMIMANCKVDFISFTEPTAKLINNHFWVIATLEPVALHVSCPNKIIIYS